MSELGIWARLVRCAFPLREAVNDHLEHHCCRVVQAAEASDLTAYAFTLFAQHVVHALQLGNDPVDFHYRRARDAPDQRI